MRLEKGGRLNQCGGDLSRHRDTLPFINTTASALDQPELHELSTLGNLKLVRLS